LTNLGFLLRENLAAIFITPSSWGSQRAGHLLGIKHIFWRRCQGGKSRLLRGEFLHTHPLLYFKFFFTLFLLASFYQKHKKISILDSCFYLSCFIMLSINGWFL
jgi:hypothetical protein